MARLIIGHTTNNSTKVWVRGSSRWPEAFLSILDTTGIEISKKTLHLDEQDFFTATHNFTGLKPSKKYTVKAAFGKTADAKAEDRIRDAYTEGHLITFPASGTKKTKFILGSCNLHSLGVIKNPDKAWSRISGIAKSTDADFMIHCGDQIYADIPLQPTATLDHYRDKYLDAWEDCKPAQRVLTQLPHYMVLDDHEIDNNFDHESFPREHHADIAMKAYYEFQHKHNPDTPPLGKQRRYFYNFSHGDVQFFVLDTRYKRDSSLGQMIDATQMRAFKRWLTTNKSKLKFVVTSVPFLGELMRPGKDKWCSPEFENQRFEILEHLVHNKIKKTVFLTGDMHTSYHATMELTGENYSSTLHELMSSPINQFTPETSASDKYDSGKVVSNEVIQGEFHLDDDEFYGNHSNVMVIATDGSKISFEVHRTTKNEKGIRGSFSI